MLYTVLTVPPESPAAVERVSPLSGGERTCPLGGGAAEAGNRKLSTGTRLHNEAWMAGAPLATEEFLLAFGGQASGFFKPGV
ncbi:unnamed protein product, partial [Staurois parvus]